MLCSFIWYNSLNFSFCHLKFYLLLKIILFEYDTESSLTDSEKNNILLQYKIGPAEPESLDLFINSSPIWNCLQNLVPWVDLLESIGFPLW